MSDLYAQLLEQGHVPTEAVERASALVDRDVLEVLVRQTRPTRAASILRYRFMIASEIRAAVIRRGAEDGYAVRADPRTGDLALTGPLAAEALIDPAEAIHLGAMKTIRQLECERIIKDYYFTAPIPGALCPFDIWDPVRLEVQRIAAQRGHDLEFCHIDDVYSHLAILGQPTTA